MAAGRLISITDDKGVTRPCLAKQMREDDITRFCEERIGLARIAIASEGDDLAAAEDSRIALWSEWGKAARFPRNGERAGGDGIR